MDGLKSFSSSAKRQAPQHYTEWNSSSNPRDPRHDEPYAAAFVAKTALEASDLVQGYSFWTFSDIFEENYFPSVPFHGGFGLLNLQGRNWSSPITIYLAHRVEVRVVHVPVPAKLTEIDGVDDPPAFMEAVFSLPGAGGRGHESRALWRNTIKVNSQPKNMANR